MVFFNYVGNIDIMRNNLLKRLVFMFFLLLLYGRIGAQIAPEVYFGAKFIPDGYGVLSNSTFPMAGEVKAGINLGEKFYTGLNSSIHRKRSEIDGYNFDNKRYQFEFELRRTFNIGFVPGLALSLSLNPGYLIYVVDHNDLDDYLTPHIVNKKMTLSANAGVSYSLNKNVNASVWPGVTWIANRQVRFDGPYSSFFIGTGISYIF